MNNLKNLLYQYETLGIKNAINFEEFNKILITTHSTKIEGSTISFAEATELIQNRNTPAGKNIDFSLQVLDHHNALNFVISEAQKGRKISVEFIREVASKVMAKTGVVYPNALGVVDASKGEFRNTSVRAGNTSFMNFQKVPSAMENLVKNLNEFFPTQQTLEEKLMLSFYAHYELVNIHPFLDGNGRTARLLMNFIQQKYDLPLAIVFSEDKPKYYEALNSVKETERYDKFYDFMFGQYEKYLQQEIEKEQQSQNEEVVIKPRFRR